MQLTRAELDVLRRLDTDHRQRFYVAFGTGAFIAVYTALRFAGVIPFTTVPIDNLVLGLAAVLLGATLNNQRQQERYRQLLLRFSNNDPEIITALSSDQTGTDGVR